MIKIGDFADLFDVSIKTIRFYESKGLLKPAYVDIYSGYRYYDEQNIIEMSKIVALKNLGLNLNEIRNLDEGIIQEKLKIYKNKLKEISKDIHILQTLSKENGGVNNLKTFVNDEQAIGKWVLEGVYESRKDYPSNKSNFEVGIKELYLMPKGKEYWVISWTKGIIYIKNRENKYEIEDDILFLQLSDPLDFDGFKLVVYKKVNNNIYTIKDIEKKDNVNVEYVKDEELIGFWKSVDFINKKDLFNGEKASTQEFPLKQIVISPNDKVIVDYGEMLHTTKYTKHFLINLCLENTLCAYEYKVIDDNTYLIVEWKSGDYVYGNMINGYYVLKKIKI